MVRRLAAVLRALEDVVDDQHAAGLHPAGEAGVVVLRVHLGVAAVDEQQRRAACASGAATVGRATDDGDDLVLETGARDRAAERPAACPSGRISGSTSVGSWCSQPAWFSSEPRWWSRVNTVPPTLAGRGAEVDRGLAAVGADLQGRAVGEVRRRRPVQERALVLGHEALGGAGVRRAGRRASRRSAVSLTAASLSMA